MSLHRKKNQTGFTMIELMVVVVVVGILASIAIPLYGKYVKNSRVAEATGRIGEIVTAAKSWAMENPNGSGVPMWPTSAPSGVYDLTATQCFTYAATPTNPATTGSFVVVATGIGKMAGVTVTVTTPNINSNGNAPVVAGL
jgi:prepilin-type N-terminal cleavage/methylation domain-containing protein